MVEAEKTTATKTPSCYCVTRKAAIADGTALKLQGRVGANQHIGYGNISIPTEVGVTRVTGNVPTCQLMEIFP